MKENKDIINIRRLNNNNNHASKSKLSRERSFSDTLLTPMPYKKKQRSEQLNCFDVVRSKKRNLPIITSRGETVKNYLNFLNSLPPSNQNNHQGWFCQTGLLKHTQHKSTFWILLVLKFSLVFEAFFQFCGTFQTIFLKKYIIKVKSLNLQQIKKN